MKPELILQADLLDIIFEDRNKDYGAYVLRKEYPDALQTALTFVMSCSIVISVWFLSSGNPNYNTDKARKIVDVDSVIILPPPRPDDPPPPPSPRASIEHVTPRIVKDGTDTIPTVESLDQPVEIGSITRSGDTSDLTGPVSNITETPATQVEAASAPEPPTIYRYVQEMPEFPGGNAALQRFLIKHLRVPDESLDQGSRVTVEVQFIVDKNGTITGMEILRSGGEVFNKEVLRVLQKMPVWKPGRQNGMQVPVYFRLPVTFQIE